MDGITDYEDLERRTSGCATQLAAQRADQIAAQAAIQDQQELLASTTCRRSATTDASRPRSSAAPRATSTRSSRSTRAANDGIEVGMAVVTRAGLVGKVTTACCPTGRT